MRIAADKCIYTSHEFLMEKVTNNWCSWRLIQFHQFCEGSPQLSVFIAAFECSNQNSVRSIKFYWLVVIVHQNHSGSLWRQFLQVFDKRLVFGHAVISVESLTHNLILVDDVQDGVSICFSACRIDVDSKDWGHGSQKLFQVGSWPNINRFSVTCLP